MNSNKHTGQESKTITFTRLRIIKNLVIICLTFALLFSAYDGLSMLQSTMNGKQGLGSYSQALIYFMFAVSSLLFPNYFIKKLGCKTNLFLGSIMYSPFVASNIYPTWATMMTSAVLIGFGASLLWAAQCTYFNEAAGFYCNLLDNCKEEDNKPPQVCKSEVMNSELFIIQNSITDKMLSEMKSGDRFIKLDPFKETAIALTISLDNLELKTSVINTKIDCGLNMVIDEKIEFQSEKIQLNDDSISNINTIEHEKISSVTDSVTNFDNSYIQSKECILKEYGYKYVDNTNTSNTNPIVYSSDLKNNTQFSTDEYTTQNNDDTRRSSSIESVTARFFGCFGLTYCSAQIWSNLITYFVLNISNEANMTHTANYSCGAGFCNSKYETISSKVDEVPLETRYLLIGITLTLSATASLLVLIFLDPLDDNREDVKFSLSHVTAVFNHIRKKEQFCIIPLSIFSGMSQGFFTADFTKSYIQCGWSTSHVGLVVVFYGLTSGISSSMSGWAVKYLGQIPVMLLGLALHLGGGVFLLFWNPDSENPFWFYFAAGLIGVVVGLFYSQILAFYGLLFKNDQETAFATHYFCSGLGWTISFIYGDYLCTSIKIYIIMVASCVGICGYLTVARNFYSRIKQ